MQKEEVKRHLEYQESSALEYKMKLDAGVTAGVRLLATAHAERPDELRRRGLPMELFDYSVQITGRGSHRCYHAEKIRC